MKIFVFFAMIMFMISCGQRKESSESLTIFDWREGNDLCRVHGGKMETILVKRVCVCIIDPEFEKAFQKFPFCSIDWGEDEVVNIIGKQYLCLECQRSYRDYLRK